MKYIIIPKIDIVLQNQITELVKESHKVKESKQLEQAKNRVEELIEAQQKIVMAQTDKELLQELCTQYNVRFDKAGKLLATDKENQFKNLLT